MKKRNNYPYHHAVALLLPVVLMVLVGACTADDGLVPWPGEAPATSAPPLTITVTDGAYAPAPTANDEDDATAPATRAVERGYATEFTAGDKIGLYEVMEKERSDGTSEYSVSFKNENLCLTYDGTAWTLPPGAELTPERPADGIRMHYYAYYPWQKDKDMGGKTVTEAGEVIVYLSGTPWTPREFFDPLISGWQPVTYQNTYAAYTASDLMVSRGTVTNGTDGTDGSELHFEMEHQMVLAVIQVPTTKYTYTEIISGKTTTKDYRLYSGMSISGWWQENSYTTRRLMSPNKNEAYDLRSIYYNSLPEIRQFGVQFYNGYFLPGTYRLYTIDGGKAEVKERSLKAGDFYMRDGSILPQEAAKDGDLPYDVQKDCLGVVFWVGENEGRHWTQTEYKYGDHLLMRDHPQCTRGMAVALHDASSTVAAWATGEGASERLYDWANGFGGFTPAEQADWEAIEASGSDYGYCSSRLMKLYGAYHSTTTFPAYNQIDTYVAAHPAPDGSSGWFFPGKYELAMMCYGMTRNFTGIPTARRDLLNGLFPKAGGEAFRGIYWSNDDSVTKAWTIDFDGNTRYDNKPKTDTYRVRAVIAF